MEVFLRYMYIPNVIQSNLKLVIIWYVMIYKMEYSNNFFSSRQKLIKFSFLKNNSAAISFLAA